MAGKVQKPCKICGKRFTPCADCENDKAMFRWKRVACSPECAKKYFAEIEKSRQPENIAVQPEKTRKKNHIKNKEREQID